MDDLIKRLESLKGEADRRNTLSANPLTGQYWQGQVDAFNDAIMYAKLERKHG